MSRARGNGPSKSSRAKPATSMSGSYNTSLDYVQECARVYAEVCRVQGQFPAFRSHWQRWEKRRPLLRTRTSGLVGPEPDISARESDIPRKLVWKLVYDSGLDTHYFQSKPHLGNNVVVSNHDCIGSFGWTDEQVKTWTVLANAAGIEYQGKRGYKAPKGFVAQDHKFELSFRQKKEIGLIPRHRRSDPAKIRRAALRGKREAVVKPLQASCLFATRYRLSAAERRSTWWNTRREVPFRDFQSSCERGICLSAKGCRSPVPGIVYKALKRLYEKPERFLPDQLWFSKPVEDLKYTISVSSPPRAVLEKRYLAKGALVRSFRSDVDALEPSDILFSTIPRVRRVDRDFLEPWTRYGNESFTHTKCDVDLSLW